MHSLDKKMYLLKGYCHSDSFCTFFFWVSKGKSL